jgi:hypothetical protein
MTPAMVHSAITVVATLLSMNLLAAVARDNEGWERSFGGYTTMVKGMTTFLGTLIGGYGVSEGVNYFTMIP